MDTEATNYKRGNFRVTDDRCFRNTCAPVKLQLNMLDKWPASRSIVGGHFQWEERKRILKSIAHGIIKEKQL